MRVLITGSRTWDDRDKIREVLTPLPGDAVLVSGACPSGADRLCEEVWEGELGRKVERHPADWRRGRGAGIERNKAMVHLGADACIAFWDGESNGTRHCANYATMHGIPTTWYILGEE